MRSVLFHLAKTKKRGIGVRWGVSHLSSWLPVERLYESATGLAFYPPRPVYPVHVLNVPKQPIKSLLDLHEGQMELMNEVLLAAQAVICQLNLEELGYRLIVNGGAYQEVELLHFHLISEESIKE